MTCKAASSPAAGAAITPKPDRAPTTKVPGLRIGPINGRFSTVLV